MKQILIVEPFHSLIDVITNSSTELFICDTDKSIDAVNEFIDAISVALGEDAGIGKIYVLDESNIKKFLTDVMYYMEIDISGEWDFVRNYFETRDWDLRFQKDEELSALRDMRYKEAYAEYEKYFDKVIKDKLPYLTEKYFGKIVIEGESDNSIPWDLMDIIENRLNAIRIHLS